MKVFFSILFLILLFILFIPKVWGQKRYTSFEISAPSLNTTKKIWVYLPLEYEKSNKKYPVLYMHDAQNLFDAKTSYAGEWKVEETLDSLKADVIVIGIEHGNDKRMDELTPFKNEKYGGGKADAYLDFIVSTLKPYADSTYRTKTSKKHTGIMGSSLGGLVSFYAVLKYPDVFGKAGVFSPSFWFSEEIYAIAKQAKKSKAKLYFLCGDSEGDETDRPLMVNDMNRMIEIISNNRCDCLNLTKSEVVKGGQHNEKLWAKNFGNAFQWLFK